MKGDERMLFNRQDDTPQAIDKSIFKIAAEDARLFISGEDMFVVTEFDVSAVANYYNVDVIEAFEKVLEAHNLSVEQVDIILEYSDYSTSGQLKAKIEELQRAREFAVRDSNRSRINIIVNSIAKYKQQLQEVLKKEREEKDQQNRPKSA
jgi:hypothetical protein